MADPRARSETSIGRFLVYAGPLAWAVLILFHPNPGGDSPYEGIGTSSTAGCSSTSDSSS